MKKIIPAILIFAFGLSFCFAILPVEAAGLVPCGQKTDDPATEDSNEGQMCTLCHLLVGINRIIKYGIRIMIYVALTMITVGGIWYIVSAGDEGMMQTAKGILKSALIGVVIVLLAWLAVNITMRALSAIDKNEDGYSDFGLTETDKWYEFKCE